jgi:hypothetical protein
MFVMGILVPGMFLRGFNPDQDCSLPFVCSRRGQRSHRLQWEECGAPNGDWSFVGFCIASMLANKECIDFRKRAAPDITINIACSMAVSLR